MDTLLRLHILVFVVLCGPIAVAAAGSVSIALPVSSISLDPRSVQDQSSLLVARQVNCQLIRQRGRAITNELAEEVKLVTPLEVSFKIRSDRFFSDGTKVTPNDVVATLLFLKESRIVLRNIFEWVKSIRVEGQSVIVQLHHAAPQFLNQLAAPNYAIFSEKFLLRAKKDPQLWLNPIGCGDYKISRQSADRLQINPVNSKVGVPIEFHYLGRNSMSKDELKAFDISPVTIDESTGAPEAYRAELSFDPYHIFLALNSSLPKWSMRNARCKFFSHLDTLALVSHYKGAAERAVDVFPRGVLGYSSQWAYQDHFRAIREGQPTERIAIFKLSVLGVSIPAIYREEYKKFIETGARQVDLSVRENPKNYGENFRRSGDDGILMGLKSNYLDGYEYLLTFSEGGSNVTGDKGRALTSEIKASQELGDSNLRALAYQRLSKKIRDECLVYPILTVPYKKVYVRKEIETPGLGSVPFNEYALVNVKRAN